MDRRQALKLLTALGATGLTAACGADIGADAAEPVSDEPVRIGMLAAQAGRDKPIGDEMINAFRLYLKLNDGRLGGHPAELIVADEGSTVDSGKAALDGLVKQGVLALTGVVSSAVMTGIRDAVEQAKVPLIGSNASPTTLQSVIYIWRTSYVNDEAGLALGPYAARQVPRGGRVAITAPQDDAGQDAVRGFQRSFGADNRIAEPIWAPNVAKPNKSTYTAVVNQLIALNPDAIYCFFAGDAAVEFLKRLYGAGYRKKIYAPGFLTEGTVLSRLKREAENIETALNYSTDLNNSANRRFASAYRKEHNGASPTTYAVASYDAAQVIDKAIRTADRPLNPAALNRALGQLGQIDSPRGAWQFNQSRTPQQKWYLRRVQRDGQVLSNLLVSELATLG